MSRFAGAFTARMPGAVQVTIERASGGQAVVYAIYKKTGDQYAAGPPSLATVGRYIFGLVSDFDGVERGDGVRIAGDDHLYRAGDVMDDGHGHAYISLDR